MAQLFTGSFSIPAGVQQRTTSAIPGGIKQAGVPLTLRLTVDTRAFPAGTTVLTLELSTDGGSTYHSCSITIDGPVPQPAEKWTPLQPMTYCLGANDVVTHARITTSAPSAFTLPVTVEAF